MRWVVGIGIGFAVYSAGWIAFDRREPLDHLSTIVTTPEVVRGGTLLLDYKVHRNRNCSSFVQRTIVDGARVEWPSDDHAFRFSGPVGDDRYTANIVVPMIATPGAAEYRVTVVYKCDLYQAFWPIIDQLPTQKFTILDK